LPKFTKKIESSFEYEGRPVKVSGGIFQSDDPARHWRGYNVFYMGRLIGKGGITNKGVSEDGPSCHSFCFIVELENDANNRWHVATNKNDSNDISGLLQTIYSQHTWGILKEGAEQSQSVELNELERLMNEAAKAISDPNYTPPPTGNRTQGKKKFSSGSANETKLGPKKKKTNTAKDDGKYDRNTGSHKRKTFSVSLAPLDGDTLGDVQEGTRHPKVIINTKNSWVESHKGFEYYWPIAVTVYHAWKRYSVTETDYETGFGSVLKEIGNNIALLFPSNKDS
jgi:hypothetical protein